MSRTNPSLPKCTNCNLHKPCFAFEVYEWLTEMDAFSDVVGRIAICRDCAKDRINQMTVVTTLMESCSDGDDEDE